MAQFLTCEQNRIIVFTNEKAVYFFEKGFTGFVELLQTNFCLGWFDLLNF
jgi:hypothetical protein